MQEQSAGLKDERNRHPHAATRFRCTKSLPVAVPPALAHFSGKYSPIKAVADLPSFYDPIAISVPAYHYVVIAVDLGGNAGVNSNQTTGTIPTPITKYIKRFSPA